MAGTKREFIAGSAQVTIDKWLPGLPGESICPLCGSSNVMTRQFPNDRQSQEQMCCKECSATGPKVDIGATKIWLDGIR